MKAIIWLLAFVSVVYGGENPSCASWTAIERKLKDKISETSCKKNDLCTSMSCVLHKFGYEMHSGVQLNPCENPASMELEVDIPKLNINSWKRKFYHGDKFSLTGGFGGEVGIEKKNSDLIISLTVHFQEENKLSPLLHLSNFQYPVFQNIAFPIQPCTQSTSVATNLKHLAITTVPSTRSPIEIYKSSISDVSNCSIMNTSCAENEICKQIDRSKPDGICVCNLDYVRGKDGKCYYSPTSTTTTITPSSAPAHGSTSNTSLLLTAILVPITVIILIVGIVFATIRFRICQHLRRRLRVQVYEHVLLGQDDDNDDDDDVLTNPVA